MTSVKVKFRPSTVDGKEGRLYYQIIHNSTVRFINTPCKVFPSEWDGKREAVIRPSASADDRRGAYVAVIVNEINGRGMTVMADPDMPDTDAWIIDPAGFGLVSLQGRAITDSDATPQGFDGIKRMALGEVTFLFKNANARLCRVKNLKGSVAALSALRS